MEYPDLPTTVRPVSHSEELSVSQPPENLTFSDDNYNSVEDHGQLKGTILICELTLESSCPLSELHLLTQTDI